MNGAFNLYRGGPRLAHTTKSGKEAVVTTHDISSSESLAQEQQPLTKSRSRRLSEAWKEVKNVAREHHNSVNAAYTAYYGLGAYRAQAVKEMKLRGAY
jgi:hypothetical protein